MNKLDKTYAIKEYEEIVDYSNGFSFNDGLNSGIGVKSVANTPINEKIARTYLVDEGYFVTETGSLYRISGTETILTLDKVFLVPPDVCQFDYQGVKATLFGNDKNGILLSTEGRIILPSGNYCKAENHFGALYVASENKIRYSERYDQLNFFSSRYDGGEINIDKIYGQILKLISVNNYLYIFCERAIFRLEAFGNAEEIKLKRIFEEIEKVNINSVVKCGGEIIFISGKRLYSIKNDNITEICKFIKGLDYELPPSIAFYDNGKYFTKIAIANSANNILIARDVFDKSEYLLDINSAEALGGFIINGDKTKIGKIADTQGIFSKINAYEIKFKAINLGDIKRKRITGVVINGKFSAINFEIKGKYGVESRNVSENKRENLNISGESFIITIKGTNRIKIDAITLIYHEEEN